MDRKKRFPHLPGSLALTCTDWVIFVQDSPPLTVSTQFPRREEDIGLKQQWLIEEV